jgi:hypothetical protein
MSTNNDNNDEFTFARYQQHVRTIAAEAMEQAGEDAREDFLHESADGSRFVFLGVGALATLQHSGNRSRIFEEVGRDALANCASIEEAYSRAAYWALLFDVRDEVKRRTPRA